MNVHTYLLVSLFLLTPHLLKSASQKPAHYLKRDSKKKGPRITTPVVLQKLALSGYCDDSDTLQLQDALLMNKERRLSWLQHHATGGNASAAYLLAKNYLEKEDKPALAWKCFSSHLALAQKNYHRRLLLGDARLYPCYSRYDFCRKERNLRQQCWERMPDDKKEEFITSPDESIRQQRWLHFANGAPFPPEQCTAIKDDLLAAVEEGDETALFAKKAADRNGFFELEAQAPPTARPHEQEGTQSRCGECGDLYSAYPRWARGTNSRSLFCCEKSALAGGDTMSFARCASSHNGSHQDFIKYNKVLEQYAGYRFCHPDANTLAALQYLFDSPAFNPKKARYYLEKGIRQGGQSAYYYLGSLEFIEGNEEKAIALFKRGALRPPLETGRAQDSNNPDDAASLNQLIPNGLIQFTLGRIYQQRGNYPEALKWFAQANTIHYSQPVIQSGDVPTLEEYLARRQIPGIPSKIKKIIDKICSRKNLPIPDTAPLDTSQARDCFTQLRQRPPYLSLPPVEYRNIKDRDCDAIHYTEEVKLRHIKKLAGEGYPHAQYAFAKRAATTKDQLHCYRQAMQGSDLRIREKASRRYQAYPLKTRIINFFDRLLLHKFTAGGMVALATFLFIYAMYVNKKGERRLTILTHLIRLLERKISETNSVLSRELKSNNAINFIRQYREKIPPSLRSDCDEIIKTYEAYGSQCKKRGLLILGALGSSIASIFISIYRGSEWATDRFISSSYA